MEFPKSLNLNLNRSLLFSLLIHGALVLSAVGMGVTEAINEPLGMEIQYAESSSAATKNRSQQVQVTADKDVVAEVTAPAKSVDIGDSPKKIGSILGTSEKGASEGPLGVAHGIEVSPEQRYLYEVQKILEARKKYPMVARKMGHSGTVVMQFTILADGTIALSEVMKASPHNTLNQAALALVRSINGLKPFPPEIHRTSWSMTIPINYQLN